MIRKIVDFMNWLTDMDWGWWPVIRLRPSKENYIDSKLVLMITPIFGSTAGLIVAFFGFNILTPEIVILSVVGTWPVFFIAYRFTFALAWNERADVLRNATSVRPISNAE